MSIDKAWACNFRMMPQSAAEGVFYENNQSD